MLIPGFESGTDGQAPRALDSALLGGPPQRVGTFEYRYDTDTWTWSDTVAQMHGYEPDEVQPTTELVLSHKHPDDLAHVKALLKQSSALQQSPIAYEPPPEKPAKSSLSVPPSPTLPDRPSRPVGSMSMSPKHSTPTCNKRLGTNCR